MNTIRVKVDQSDYEIYDDFLNIEIDGFWLDEKLDSLYPNNFFKGLIPTLLFAMEIDQEKEVVWNRIKPKQNSKVICPVLMCPDDCDFSCTLIVAEIENTNDTIKWLRIGIDQTHEFEPEKVGSKVEWFEKLQPLEFAKSEYLQFVLDFEKQHHSDKKKWEQINNI